MPIGMIATISSITVALISIIPGVIIPSNLMDVIPYIFAVGAGVAGGGIFIQNNSAIQNAENIEANEMLVMQQQQQNRNIERANATQHQTENSTQILSNIELTTKYHEQQNQIQALTTENNNLRVRFDTFIRNQSNYHIHENRNRRLFDHADSGTQNPVEHINLSPSRG